MQSEPNVSEPDTEPDYDAAWNLFVGIFLLALMVGAFGVSALIVLHLAEAAFEVFG